jgi:hypothetical protein
LHPGLIILPSVPRLEAQRLMDHVIDHLLNSRCDRPEDLLVNAVLKVSIAGFFNIEPLP